MAEHVTARVFFLSDLAKTIKENRTIAEILEDGDVKVGYLWMTDCLGIQEAPFRRGSPVVSHLKNRI